MPPLGLWGADAGGVGRTGPETRTTGIADASRTTRKTVWGPRTLPRAHPLASLFFSLLHSSLVYLWSLRGVCTEAGAAIGSHLRSTGELHQV